MGHPAFGQSVQRVTVQNPMSFPKSGPLLPRLGSMEIDIFDRAIQAHREYYEELSENWRHLDSKAQNSIPLVGILLAVFVAFATRQTASRCVADRVLAIAEIVLLSASASVLIGALSVRECDYPPYSGATQELLEELRGVPVASRQPKLQKLAESELDKWAVATDSVEAVNSRKGKWIKVAHFILLAAVLLFAIFAVIQVLE
jgi:hypothetical protein